MIKGASFTEKWKVMALALVAGAGIVATALLTFLIFIVWLGDWSEAVEVLEDHLLFPGGRDVRGNGNNL